MNPFLRDEEAAMWLFLLRQIHNPLTGDVEIGRVKPRGLEIWRKFKEEEVTTRTDTSLRKRFSVAHFPTPREFEQIDEIGVVKLHFALSIPLDDDHVETLRQNAEIELDEAKRIQKYVGNSNGLVLETFRKRRLPCGRKRKAGRNEETDEEIELERSEDHSEDVHTNGEYREDSVPSAVAEVVANLHEEAEEQVGQFLRQLYSTKINGVCLVPEAAAPLEPTASQKTCLEHLKTYVDGIDSPALRDVQNRINVAIQNQERDEEKYIPMDRVRLILESTLAMMGL